MFPGSNSKPGRLLLVGMLLAIVLASALWSQAVLLPADAAAASAAGRASAAQQATPDAQPAPCSRPEDFRPYRGLGPACRLSSGVFRVRLRDGATVITHGVDRPGSLPDRPGARISAARVPYTCVPETTQHAQAIYAVPSDQPDNFATKLAVIREQFQQANDLMAASAAKFGVTASFKVACESDGQIKVIRVPLPNVNAQKIDFYDVVDDLQRAGYSSQFAKYWVWVEQPRCGGGVGGAPEDSRPSVDNPTNRGPHYGLNFSCPFGYSLHEATHAMGAVHSGTPNSTQAGHCIDDSDVMCYNDGGPRASLYRSNVCPSTGLDDNYDCNNDDYFHPSPPAGSYLAAHWNLAACYHLFIQRSGCGTPTATATLTPVRTPTPTPVRTPTPTPALTPTAVPDAPPTQAWYRMNETSGTTAADSSGSGRTAALVNGPTWVAGRTGNAVNLDGSNDYISLPAGVVSGLSDFTVATWVRLDTLSAWQRVFDFGSSTTTNMFLTVSTGMGIRFAITTGGAGAEQRISGTAALPTGVWKHVAVTKEGSVGRLYVDGALVGQNTALTLSPASLGSTSNNWLGRSQYADPYLDGQIDDFRIYSRALSAAEVQTLFSQP